MSRSFRMPESCLSRRWSLADSEASSEDGSLLDRLARSPSCGVWSAIVSTPTACARADKERPATLESRRDHTDGVPPSQAAAGVAIAFYLIDIYRLIQKTAEAWQAVPSISPDGLTCLACLIPRTAETDTENAPGDRARLRPPAAEFVLL